MSMSSFSPSMGSSHKLPSMLGEIGNAGSKILSQGQSNDDRRSQAAQHAAKLLENSEELFRASLSAKNEEISKMTDVLRSVRAELAREVHLVHKLNAQLASAQEDLDANESALAKASQRVADLEKENAEMKCRLELIIEGNELKPRSSEDESNSRLVNEATISALRQRAQLAERDVAVLSGLVSAMKQMLASQWDQQSGDTSPLQEKARALEKNQAAWEAETMAAKERAQALERQLQGKDETIQALRAQLLNRK